MLMCHFTEVGGILHVFYVKVDWGRWASLARQWMGFRGPVHRHRAHDVLGAPVSDTGAGVPWTPGLLSQVSSHTLN